MMSGARHHSKHHVIAISQSNINLVQICQDQLKVCGVRDCSLHRQDLDRGLERISAIILSKQYCQTFVLEVEDQGTN